MTGRGEIERAEKGSEVDIDIILIYINYIIYYREGDASEHREAWV